jgi:hypothetical protein
MNPDRVRERGIRFVDAVGAVLEGYRLRFDKASSIHPGVGHASIHIERSAKVEGVLYTLHAPGEIEKMDRFERTPINYSRDIVVVETARGPEATWTYFANPAVCIPGLKPPRSYLAHLLAGREFLSGDYFATLERWECGDG